MTTVTEVAAFLEQLAPHELAESWDNVGLLVGHRRAEVHRLMACLTVTPATAEEARQRKAEMIVAHHPLPFRPVERLTSDTMPGRLLLELASASIAVYSAHTAFDSAREGINQLLAAGLRLRGITPLVVRQTPPGIGRFGWLEQPVQLDDLARRVMDFLKTPSAQIVGHPEQPIRMVAVGCGAADELLRPAIELGCDAMILGEARFHTCLEAEAADVGLVLPGHFASERFAVEQLAETLARRFTELEVWASREERDPLQWIGPGT